MQPDRGQLAEAALARSHRRRGVALCQLDRVEAFGDRTRHVLLGDVLADADEALSAPGVSRARARRLAALAGDGAGSFDVRRQVSRHEDAPLRVELDPGAGLGEQRVGGLRTAGDDEQVARDGPPSDLHAREVPAALRLEGAQLVPAQIDDLGDLRPGAPQDLGRLDSGVVGRDDYSPLPGPDREVGDEPPDGAREHDPREVIAREDERLLDRARGDDDAPRAKPEEERPRGDGDEAAFVDADRAGGGENLEGRKLGRPAGESGAFVDERDPATCRRRVRGGRKPGRAAADHEHVDGAMLRVEAARAASVFVDLAETRCVAQHPFVQRPGPARPDHRPVVEADRHEAAADLVDDGHQVAVERPQHVLRAHARPLAGRLDADPHVRDAVHFHQAVRATAGAAEEPACAVVLEAAGKDAAAGGEEGGPDRVAGEGLERLVAEGEGERAGAVDALAGAGRKPHATNVLRTSFVRVSRSAWNHVRQPRRWYHHSR